MTMFGKILVVIGFVAFFFNVLVGVAIFIIGLLLGLLGEHWEVMEQSGREAIKEREQEKREHRRSKARRFGQKVGGLFGRKA